MNIIFESRFYASDEFYKEYVNKILFQKIRKQTLVISIIDVILIVLMLLIRSKFVGILILVCIANILYSLVYLPKKTVKQIKENDEQINKGIPTEAVVQFSNSKISVSEGAMSFETEYESISRICFCTNICSLFYTKNNCINLSMNDFAVGDKDSFRKFIIEKCPNVKIEYLL